MIKKEDAKISSQSFFELLTKPKDLWEVLKLKTFHVTNTVLPFWVKGFVRVVDYGERGEAWWKRNLKAQITGIGEGDIKQACDREFLPVVFLSYQNATKGISLIYNGVRNAFGLMSSNSGGRLGFFGS